MVVTSRGEDTAVCDPECKIYMEGECLENVQRYNYLGVMVDNRFSFGDFGDQKYSKANLREYQLKQLRPYMNSDIANRIYKQQYYLF